MFGLTGRRVVFFVTELVAFAPLAHADEPTQSQRAVMYYRYLEFGGCVETRSLQVGSQ